MGLQVKEMYLLLVFCKQKKVRLMKHVECPTMVCRCCSRLQSRLCFKHTDLIDAQEGENGPPIVGGVTKLTWVILDNDPSRHLLVSTGTDCTLR